MEQSKCQRTGRRPPEGSDQAERREEEDEQERDKSIAKETTHVEGGRYKTVIRLQGKDAGENAR